MIHWDSCPRTSSHTTQSSQLAVATTGRWPSTCCSFHVKRGWCPASSASTQPLRHVTKAAGLDVTVGLWPGLKSSVGGEWGLFGSFGILTVPVDVTCAGHLGAHETCSISGEGILSMLQEFAFAFEPVPTRRRNKHPYPCEPDTIRYRFKKGSRPVRNSLEGVHRRSETEKGDAPRRNILRKTSY